jgi:hypothetical protein
VKPGFNHYSYRRETSLRIWWLIQANTWPSSRIKVLRFVEFYIPDDDHNLGRNMQEFIYV